MSGLCLTKRRIGGMIQIKSSQTAEPAPSQDRWNKLRKLPESACLIICRK